MFELTVLLSAFGAVFGMLALNGLPRFYHPSFNYSRIAGATNDRYLLVVEASDPKFDIDEESLGIGVATMTTTVLKYLGGEGAA